MNQYPTVHGRSQAASGSVGPMAEIAGESLSQSFPLSTNPRQFPLKLRRPANPTASISKVRLSTSKSCRQKTESWTCSSTANASQPMFPPRMAGAGWRYTAKRSFWRNRQARAAAVMVTTMLPASWPLPCPGRSGQWTSMKEIP